MPLNKIGDVFRDIQSYPFTGGKHVFRVSAAVNTLESEDTKPVIITNKIYEAVKKFGFNYSTPGLAAFFKEIGALAIQMPYTLNDTKSNLLILCVYNVDAGELECYPFSNANPEGKFWPYDIRFFVVQPSSDTPGFRKGTFNPWAIGEKLDEDAIAHMNALGALTLSVVKGLASGKFELIKESTDYTALNKSRKKKDLPPVRPDCFLQIAGDDSNEQKEKAAASSRVHITLNPSVPDGASVDSVDGEAIGHAPGDSTKQVE